MTIRISAASTASVLLFFSVTAGAATPNYPVLTEAWLIPVLVALACAIALFGLWMLMARRRRAKALAAVVVGARDRSLQRHTERQRLATQFSDLSL
ncbi:hypothetical protein [Variovorax sp. YR216]|uniref:hypothetical protein n=1 Tax=Variovorax sp. YR216 TaxID=1882828 RepID=UPI00089665EF|nr:hypothetical protein [Variovorax sp. YR216]SEB25814.1 hypothetical protein SAMN05444680_12763 [Variovorax sp. YR216]